MLLGEKNLKLEFGASFVKSVENCWSYGVSKSNLHNFWRLDNLEFYLSHVFSN